MTATQHDGERIGVMCIGNLLLRDEGLGPLVAQRLSAEYEFPANVEVVDSGTMGMSLIGQIASYDYLIVVDAVDGTGEAPGTVFTFTPEEMARCTIMHSLHDIRFKDVLDAASLLGTVPEAVCVGAQVLDMNPVDFSIGLTDVLDASVPLVMETVVSLLAARGVEVTRR